MLRDDLKNIKSSTRDVRNFGFALGAVLGIFAFISWWREGGAWPTLITLAALFALFARFYVPALRPVQRALMTVGMTIGFIVTNVILAAVFFLVITPIAFVMRRMGKHFLELTFDRRAGTYWNHRSVGPLKKEDLEQQF